MENIVKKEMENVKFSPKQKKRKIEKIINNK